MGSTLSSTFPPRCLNSNQYYHFSQKWMSNNTIKNNRVRSIDTKSNHLKILPSLSCLYSSTSKINEDDNDINDNNTRGIISTKEQAHHRAYWNARQRKAVVGDKY